MLVVVRDKPLRKGNKTMTRKDYQVIAQAIKDTRENYYAENLAIAHVVGVLASRLKEDNPRFDVYKFVDACGIKL